MYNKNSQITISLSWVFMIIIGTFFLVTTYTIIDKYKTNEDLKENLELKQSLRTILNKVGQTSGIEQSKLESVQNIFENSEIEIICVGDEPLLKINEEIDSNNQFLKNYPTFSNKITQRKLRNTYLAVENFKLPFKITNMLAIVNTNNIIIFDENMEVLDELLKKFNKGAYKNKINPLVFDLNNFDLNTIKNIIDNKNPETITIVTDNENKIKNLKNIHNINIDFQIIEINKISNNKGKIKYYNKNLNLNQTYNYIDIDNSYSLVTMAIFSSNEAFSCSYNKIFNNIKNNYNFYINKTNYLEKSNLKLCKSSQSSQQEKIDYHNIKNKLNEINLEIESNKFINLENVDLLLEELKILNENLENKGCKYVY